MSEVRMDFKKNVAYRIALQGSLSRNSIYEKDIEDSRKKKFRQSLQIELVGAINKIEAKTNYNNEDHYSSIIDFANRITVGNSDILSNHCLNIGTAQKMLNLYWKMIWLFDDKVKMPIHCPFDSIVIRELGSTVKWTRITFIEEYIQLVNAADVTSKSESLTIAEWELEVYNKSIYNKE